MEEIELTFLAKKSVVEKLKGTVTKEMLDIYIPVSSEHPTLRVRKSGTKYEMTKKEPIKDNDSSHMLETTIPLTPEEFSDLNELSGKRVEKHRHIYKEGAHTFEIDVFQSDLRGLILVDVEFKTLEEKARFKIPDWCLAEVTQEKFIAGGMVCGKKYSDLRKDLEKFGYEKITI